MSGFTTKIFIIFMDIMFSSFALYCAILVTHDFDFTKSMIFFSYFSLIIIGLRFTTSLLFKTYKIIIRYIGERDYINSFYSRTIASGLILCLYLLNPPIPGFYLTPSIIIVDFFLVLALSVGARIMLRLTYDHLKFRKTSHVNAAIYGAGELGALIKNVLGHSSTHNYKIVAFFDDNPKVHHKILNGVRIFNPDKSFRNVIKKHDIKVIIFGINNITPARKKAFIENCLAEHVKVLKIPPSDSWINGTLKAGQIKNIDFEDLLNRPSIKLNVDGVTSSIHNQVILVTGCAGSIGSEIVRMLLSYKPKMIIGVDQAETPLADFILSMKELHAKDIFKGMIGDIKDQDKMARIFEEYQPDYVFHAAAYKHVPMMEMYPEESIKVNILGTKTIADLSIRHNVKKFVMISTDKVVKPGNVMGASKRIAEIYTQSLNFSGRGHTQFITTRFGNVLGSNGSVIPIFRAQIEKAQPITVTHPDITRYFMTIPEACQLVLEAGAMGRGGEIFVFDMGDPVKITDLATKMIMLAGLTPGKDIEIIYTGLRPGEKLNEELLDTREDNIPTHHPKIMKANVRMYEFMQISSYIDLLDEKVKAGESYEILVSLMKKIVPEFLSKNSVFSVLDNNE